MYESEIGSRRYIPESALRTFEEIGRIPGRVLRYLLSDNEILQLIKREEMFICLRVARISCPPHPVRYCQQISNHLLEKLCRFLLQSAAL